MVGTNLESEEETNNRHSVPELDSDVRTNDEQPPPALPDQAKEVGQNSKQRTQLLLISKEEGTEYHPPNIRVW